jgi:hypothetical protein
LGWHLYEDEDEVGVVEVEEAGAKDLPSTSSNILTLRRMGS